MPQALLQLIDASSTLGLAFPVIFTHFYPRADPLEANAQIADHAPVFAMVITIVATQCYMSAIPNQQRVGRL
jgi:hypothetical protein